MRILAQLADILVEDGCFDSPKATEFIEAHKDNEEFSQLAPLSIALKRGLSIGSREPLNVDEIVSELATKYPWRLIILLPENDPQEIIVEIERTDVTSTAMAAIRRSEPHFHRRMKEVYIVERGRLRVYVDRTAIVLHEGGIRVIHQQQVHWAEGLDDFALVRVICNPPWTPDDHILFTGQVNPMGGK